MIPFPERVEQRVSGLVNDDVVREAGVDGLAGRPREIPEDQSFVLGTVERVRVEHAVWRDVELVGLERPPMRRPSANSKRASVRMTSA